MIFEQKGRPHPQKEACMIRKLQGVSLAAQYKNKEGMRLYKVFKEREMVSQHPRAFIFTSISQVARKMT